MEAPKVDNMIDLIRKLNLPVVLVVRHYLGSLNHTLLTVEALRSRNLTISGFVMNGDDKGGFCDFLCKKVDLPCLLKMPVVAALTPAVISQWQNDFLERRKDEQTN